MSISISSCQVTINVYQQPGYINRTLTTLPVGPTGSGMSGPIPISCDRLCVVPIEINSEAKSVPVNGPHDPCPCDPCTCDPCKCVSNKSKISSSHINPNMIQSICNELANLLNKKSYTT
jgi:hypothetical protein